MAKTDSYITLVRATEDEINKEFNEIIEGQIILNTTSKTISCDEQGRRIEYVGKQMQPSICDSVDNTTIAENGDTILNSPHNKNDYFYADNKLYRALTDIKKDDVLSNSTAKNTTVCDELKYLKSITDTKVASIDDSLTSEDGTKFKFGTDGSGNYGFLKSDGTLIPFKNGGVRLDPIKITNGFSVPVVKGARYLGSFRRGGRPYGGYKIIYSFGNVDVVEATSDKIEGSSSGEDAGYNSFVVWLYKINGNLVWMSDKTNNIPDELTGKTNIGGNVTYIGDRTSTSCYCKAFVSLKNNGDARVMGRINSGVKYIKIAYSNYATNKVGGGMSAGIYDCEGNYVTGLKAGINNVSDYSSGNYWFKAKAALTVGDEWVTSKVIVELSTNDTFPLWKD